MALLTDIEQDHIHQDELKTDHLAQLPPEVCERICQMLPSLSLYCLPTISNKLCLSAKREMNIRHSKMKEKVMISESADNQLLHKKVSMICPGLVLYYSPNTCTPPPHKTTRTTLRMLKTIFTTTSSKTGQALCVPHFSDTNPFTLNTSNTIPPPKCYQLLQLPLCNPANSVLLFFIPVDPPHLQKIRSMSGWNICLPHQGGLSSILPPKCSRICLPLDHEKGLLTLAKDILGKEPELNLMTQPLMDPLKMYKDPNTLVVVVTDSNSDPGIQLVLDTFFAKVFLPLKVSWVKMVFTDMKKEEVRML